MALSKKYKYKDKDKHRNEEKDKDRHKQKAKEKDKIKRKQKITTDNVKLSLAAVALSKTKLQRQRQIQTHTHKQEKDKDKHKTNDKDGDKHNPSYKDKYRLVITNRNWWWCLCQRYSKRQNCTTIIPLLLNDKIEYHKSTYIILSHFLLGMCISMETDKEKGNLGLHIELPKEEGCQTKTNNEAI